MRYRGIDYKLENTQEIRNQYRRYRNSYENNIWEAYKNPSRRKENAWKSCVDICNDFNGRYLKIAGHNQMVFSAGFMMKDDDNRDIYCHITPSRLRFMLVEEAH